MDINEEINQRIDLLAKKYHASGQELVAYLDGLLYADYNTYWDYIHLDTLLSLQTPKTQFPDEEIFIMYHQITELYFKLSLHEMRQLSEKEDLTVDFFEARLKRINRYFSALTHSFGVMEKGMDREDFLKFRMSLIPASGFQSAQYRKIEICATDMINLVNKDLREEMRVNDAGIEEMYDKIYWKWGATIDKTGEKTLTLRQFERKYTEELIRLANNAKGVNLWQLYKRFKEEGKNHEGIEEQLKALDLNVNVNWPLQHYRTSVAYLAQRPHDVSSTGGTNWQKYLPPRFQKRIFYPELWTGKEKEEWGKKWVTDVLSEYGPKANK
ncbi:tryptophan 2,3-dioxygenase (vermilion) [Owenweeksia hongkongensis DSM 17368]|uniref:Tryptophan 2,3-dioxygenase (Vermilion) n=1 Tax=Owenweeksia hongkongensis (strain DSM 17368 / CIP 108786 / JCM 12287 / NRRL B-23963 / UST20020801) TaxID=926562 RepID=G8R045_OWEHD|nr:tryptophan 2,3-dioxygenase family protein [Owenweeksia hongkongensis]AEV33711.1 tryptophan 2,3-dioxygenase (vermilion) [Owenweeksia hongkongensis DSM 17368]